MQLYNYKKNYLMKKKNTLRTLELQNKVTDKKAEAHLKNPCSYKMKSV